jgi:hypothetical protein
LKTFYTPAKVKLFGSTGKAGGLLILFTSVFMSKPYLPGSIKIIFHFGFAIAYQSFKIRFLPFGNPVNLGFSGDVFYVAAG